MDGKATHICYRSSPHEIGRECAPAPLVWSALQCKRLQRVNCFACTCAPVKPPQQAQLKLPLLLVQVELAAQLEVPRTHSLMSMSHAVPSNLHTHAPVCHVYKCCDLDAALVCNQALAGTPRA